MPAGLHGSGSLSTVAIFFAACVPAGRGAGGYRERIKVMKLLWDAIGTEFGGRHELYERNYAGNHEDIRIQALWNTRTSGMLDQMAALAEQCMAEYDENG